MLILPKSINKFDTIPRKIPTAFYVSVEIGKPISEFIGEIETT